MIKGITVTLYEKTEVGKDKFNAGIFEENPVKVDNVLVAPVQNMELPSTVDLTGKKSVYTLGIPKGDTHDWKDVRVEFVLAGQLIQAKSFGFPQSGIEDNIPLKWNTKVLVAEYE